MTAHHVVERAINAAAQIRSGTSPIPLLLRPDRHRLNRSGDRQLIRALHIIVLTRLAHHSQT